jgi:hypothetical protein
MSQVLDTVAASSPTAGKEDHVIKGGVGAGGGDDAIAFYDEKMKKPEPEALEQPIGGNGKYSEVPVDGKEQDGSPGKTSRPDTNQTGRR